MIYFVEYCINISTPNQYTLYSSYARNIFSAICLTFVNYIKPIHIPQFRFYSHAYSKLPNHKISHEKAAAKTNRSPKVGGGENKGWHTCRKIEQKVVAAGEENRGFIASPPPTEEGCN